MQVGLTHIRIQTQLALEKTSCEFKNSFIFYIYY